MMLVVTLTSWLIKIWNASGALVYTSPANTTSPNSGRRTQGDTIQYLDGGLQGEKWSYGKATTSDGADVNGNFVPANIPGLNYISPGYL